MERVFVSTYFRKHKSRESRPDTRSSSSPFSAGRSFGHPSPPALAIARLCPRSSSNTSRDSSPKRCAPSPSNRSPSRRRSRPPCEPNVRDVHGAPAHERRHLAPAPLGVPRLGAARLHDPRSVPPLDAERHVGIEPPTFRFPRHRVEREATRDVPPGRRLEGNLVPGQEGTRVHRRARRRPGTPSRRRPALAIAGRSICLHEVRTVDLAVARRRNPRRLEFPNPDRPSSRRPAHERETDAVRRAQPNRAGSRGTCERPTRPNDRAHQRLCRRRRRADTASLNPAWKPRLGARNPRDPPTRFETCPIVSSSAARALRRAQLHPANASSADAVRLPTASSAPRQTRRVRVPAGPLAREPRSVPRRTMRDAAASRRHVPPRADAAHPHASTRARTSSSRRSVRPLVPSVFDVLSDVPRRRTRTNNSFAVGVSVALTRTSREFHADDGARTRIPIGYGKLESSARLGVVARGACAAAAPPQVRVHAEVRGFARASPAIGSRATRGYGDGLSAAFSCARRRGPDRAQRAPVVATTGVRQRRLGGRPGTANDGFIAFFLLIGLGLVVVVVLVVLVVRFESTAGFIRGRGRSPASPRARRRPTRRPRAPRDPASAGTGPRCRASRAAPRGFAPPRFGA